MFRAHEDTVGYQWQADVISTTDQGFEVAWSGMVAPDPPPEGAIIFRRAFDASGQPLHRERHLSEPIFPTSSDVFVRLARLSEGRTLAIWTNEVGTDGDAQGVFGAIFDHTGMREGEQFQVNLFHTDGEQYAPASAVSGDDFLVVWQDYGVQGDRSAVSGQRFDRLGARLGAEIDFAGLPLEIAGVPRAAGLLGGNVGEFVVVWEDINLSDPDAGYDVIAKIQRRDGTIGSRIVVSGDRMNDEGNPSVATTSNGFSVVWTNYSRSGKDVYVRHFSNDGTPLGDSTRVNTYEAGDQFGAAIATSENGNYVVVWTSGFQRPEDQPNQDGDSFGVYAQAFAADGAAIGREFQVSTHWRDLQMGGPPTAGVTFLNETDFVIVWANITFPFDADVHARRFRVSPNQRLCGDTAGADLTITSTDALGVLRAAVELDECETCRCDADSSGMLSAADAQAVLRVGVGLPVELSCPNC